MPRMTDEEADVLAELVLKTPPKVSGNGKSGFFMKHKGNIILDSEVIHDTSGANTTRNR